ncbi:ferric aerobactin receptor [Solitalea longa]|uniref:Ferric aerobactin receptor n=1 Tax=Solitalea longa TaxID=2079460 RepID=A0A2S5A5Z2_9SPHI|nr:TonB-dependent receptor [Solitalea longa]POY38021.1 ferric aerobactin receptor [Solitalea longa]
MHRFIFSFIFLSLGYSTLAQTVNPVNTKQTSNKPATKRSSSQNKTSNDSLKYNRELDEVVVSAGRTKETKSETPVTVTVINAKEIAAQASVNSNMTNVIGWTVPGLALPSNTSYNTGQTLRGRNALVLIDGIPQSTPLRAASREMRTIDPSAIERIEIVKGATSIYGNGADGGLINYITKKPQTQKFAGQTIIGGSGQVKNAGNTGGFRINQLFSGKQNAFDYSVSGSYEKTGVLKDADGNVISPDFGLGEMKTYNGFAKLGYDLNQDSRIELMYNFFRSEQRSDYVAKVGVYGETPTIGVPGERKTDGEGTPYNHNVALQYTQKNLFGGTDFSYSMYMQKFETNFGYSETFYKGGQSQLNSDKKGLRLNFVTPYTVSKNFKGDVIYGGDVLNDITSQRLRDGRSWVPDMNAFSLAPYLQLKSYLFEYLVVKAGIRYENLSVKINDYNTLATGANNKGSIAVKGAKLIYNPLTYNAGIRFSKYQQFTPYVSFSQGFSIYDLGRILRAATENTVQQLNTKAVIANNYEAGFNSRIGIFNFEAVGYISTSKLGANLVQVDGWLVPQRAPEKVKGFEVAADVFISSKLKAGASYSYSEGKIDANNDKDFDDEGDVYLSGLRISPSKLTAYVNYKPVNKLDVGLYWIRSGSRDHFEPNSKGEYKLGEGRVNSFNIFNLNAAYQLPKNFKVTLGVENLLNTNYYTPYAQFYGRADYYTQSNGARYNVALGYSF